MYKLAIVEDDPVISQMYRLKFESEGFRVQTANNGRAGLTLIQEMQPDLILLDLKMPEMSGDEVLREIRAQKWGKDIPVIILTNLGAEEAPKSLLQLNVHSYVVKAERTPSEVAKQVTEALAS